MFDREYFSKHLPAQIEELGASCCTVELWLHSGTCVRIRKISAAMENYILAEIYPHESVSDNSQSESRKPGGMRILFDRAGIPYNTMSHVAITIEEPAKQEPMGFQS